MIDHLWWNNFSVEIISTTIIISVVIIYNNLCGRDKVVLLRTGVNGCERVGAVSTDILFKKLIELLGP